ncbi:MAG TPA: efflux RND transporter periplasmic adaptor subunit [Candidatus Dormibacteraeota bacterium]|nr:efflux RND transporter periplasmic adaptor subunit [Candidatus Dormibacteraeota bacterium]
MKTWQRVAIGACAGVAAIGIVWYSVYKMNAGLVTVQTGQAVRQDLTSIVTASGEIRPKNYTNVLGEGMGRITQIAVQEGENVNKGAVLLRLDNVQPGADVQAQKATIDAATSATKAAEANYDSAVATLQQQQANLEKAKFDWQRSQELYKDQLIARQDYDASKATYRGAVASVTAARAQLAASRASRNQANFNLAQDRAMLTYQQDILNKTVYRAPIAGIVSYIAVRLGENVVPGIQNAQGSFLMTISDMSVVTAEVMVDETDITSVKDGQPASVSIDALPGKTFKGHVTEVGELAILRTSGEAAMEETTANTQEARDFKVVVTLDNPPKSLRPGLSATAKIETAHKNNVLTIPIQALAERTQGELEEAKDGQSGNVTLAAANDNPASTKEVQGVFVIRDGKAQFVPVQTGITGVTSIEVTNGLQPGDVIVTGSYNALRTLRPGTKVKIDNSATSVNIDNSTS